MENNDKIKQQQVYNIDKENYTENIANEFKQFSKELSDDIKVLRNKKPKQTTTIVFNTRIKKK